MVDKYLKYNFIILIYDYKMDDIAIYYIMKNLKNLKDYPMRYQKQDQAENKC